MRKLKEPLLNQLRNQAYRAKSGRAVMQCHGSSIEAIYRMTGADFKESVHFKMDGIWRSSSHIIDWLREKDAETVRWSSPIRAKDVRVTFTDKERLEFVILTNAQWHRDKYKTSGTLTWVLVGLIGLSSGIATTTEKDWMTAVDKAMLDYKSRGGILHSSFSVFFKNPSPPEIVIIYGPQGCGKTTNGPLFAAHYGGHCIDFDMFDPRSDRDIRVLFTSTRSDAEDAVNYCARNCFVRPRIVEFSRAMKEFGK